MSNGSIWSINRTLSGATNPGQSGSENNGNERVLHFPQIFKAGASPSDDLVSYVGQDLVGFYGISTSIGYLMRNPPNFYFIHNWWKKRRVHAFYKHSEVNANSLDKNMNSVHWFYFLLQYPVHKQNIKVVFSHQLVISNNI